jgi:hypothetical protein
MSLSTVTANTLNWRKSSEVVRDAGFGAMKGRSATQKWSAVLPGLGGAIVGGIGGLVASPVLATIDAVESLKQRDTQGDSMFPPFQAIKLAARAGFGAVGLTLLATAVGATFSMSFASAAILGASASMLGFFGGTMLDGITAGIQRGAAAGIKLTAKAFDFCGYGPKPAEVGIATTDR